MNLIISAKVMERKSCRADVGTPWQVAGGGWIQKSESVLLGTELSIGILGDFERLYVVGNYFDLIELATYSCFQDAFCYYH